MVATIIRNFIAKALFKKKGAIANNKAVEFSANALEQRLKNFGIDPNAIRSEQELNQILSAVKQAEDQAFSQRFGDMLAGSRFDRKADVLDMTGKKINPRSKIMGGKQAETEAEIAARMNRENKEAVKNIKNKKTLDDEIKQSYDKAVKEDKFKNVRLKDGRSIKSEDDFREYIDELNEDNNFDFAQGGRAGFKGGSYDRTSFEHKINELKAAYKRYKKGSSTGGRGGIMTFEQFAPLFAAENFATGGRAGYADGTPSFEEYMQERQGIEKKQNFERLYKEYLEDLRRKDVMEQKQMAADGGRIGLKAGMTKRAFLKLMGGVGAGIAGLKSGLLGIGKGAGKQVAEEVVKKSTSTPPAYFFELAEKIKTLGRVTDGPQERLKIHTMPAKDGKSELMLTEDIGTGEMQIKKISKEGDDMVTEVQTMDYTPGSSQADEATQGIPADSYDEYTEFNSRIIKDEYNDPDIVDGIKVDEIIEEVKDQAPSIKKAGGGIARMLGE